jgi:SAM-dependent MidA family methyltransferase
MLRLPGAAAAHAAARRSAEGALAMQWRGWRVATTAALYGPGGFFHRPEGPVGHFRTSVSASPLFAAALLRLAVAVDEALGSPPVFDLVDVGAGRGELLVTLGGLADRTAPAFAGRLRRTAVELAPRPRGLPSGIGWTAEIPPLHGLLVANEWLDDVPLDVVEMTESGPRVVEVDATGAERPGAPPAPDDAAWLDRWWPLSEVGARAEVGRPRDEAWAAAVRQVRRGLALAVDYSHGRLERAAGDHAAGTLVGYADGRVRRPVPDGSCDITAHVALDACAAAGAAAGATETLLTDQRLALPALGVRADSAPIELAHSDPMAYLAALAATGAVAELTAARGLGGFGWLVQGVGIPLPAALRAAIG